MGRVFLADRVIFYRTDDSGTDFAAPSMKDGFADVEESGALFRASKLWFSEAGTPPAGDRRRTLSLADFPDHGKALLEGQTSGGPPSLDSGVTRGWQVARSTLFIPCPGEDGLFGLFGLFCGHRGVRGDLIFQAWCCNGGGCEPRPSTSRRIVWSCSCKEVWGV